MTYMRMVMAKLPKKLEPKEKRNNRKPRKLFNPVLTPKQGAYIKAMIARGK